MWSLLQSPLHVASVFLLFLVPSSKGFIRAIYNRNATRPHFSALFGPLLPCTGPMGYRLEAMPSIACPRRDSPPAPSNSSTAFIVPLRCYDCVFHAEVLHAPPAGHPAATTQHANSQALAGTATAEEEIRQPAVFAGEAASQVLRKVRHSDGGAHVTLVPKHCRVSWEEDAKNSCPRACRCWLQLLGHCSHIPILLICRAISLLAAIATGTLLVVKYAMRYHQRRRRKRRRRRRNLLREEPGMKSSTSTLNGGTKYTECAICLEAYEKGDRMKILSCSHAYHSKCINLWLLTQARNKTCPLCMQRVTVAAESPEFDLEGYRQEERNGDNRAAEEEVYDREQR